MTDHDDAHEQDCDAPLPPSYPGWRRVHLLASWAVVGIGLAHCLFTAFAFRTWSPDAAWFLGAGLGVLVVGLLNVVHIGSSPCRMPTVRFVRIVNLVFFAFGLVTLFAVPEPPAVVLVVAFGVQLFAGRVTIPGPG
jgi:hypothetical protein